MKQVPFTVTPTGIEVQGVPEGARIVSIPSALARDMVDMRLHANDLDLAIQAIAQVKTDTNAFTILNIAAFSSALVFHSRCFKSSASRTRLIAEKVFANTPDALVGHRFFERIRDKHVVHDENNYFLVAPFAILVNDEAVTGERIVTAIAQAGIDRQANYVELLRNLALHAHRWAEAEADRATHLLAESLNAMPRSELEALPAPQVTFPVLGDEAKRR